MQPRITSGPRDLLYISTSSSTLSLSLSLSSVNLSANATMSTQENRPFRAPYMTDASERTLYTFHPDRLFEVSVLDYLMLRFPRLTIEDISDGNHDRSCSICQIEYQTTYAEAKDHPVVDKGEQPIKLACGHVFGHDCLSRWLPKMTCPMCRQNLLYGHVTPHGKLKVRLGQAGM